MNTNPNHPAPAEEEAIRHLKDAIASGKHWYISLLEAINIWQIPEETLGNRQYKYIIDGEVFDWLLLAERLCQTVDESIPQDEKQALLFNGEPPLKLDTDEFKQLIGSRKYQQYLNFFYGITVEEALLQVVEDEIRKERSFNSGNEDSITDEAYRRIYDCTQHNLLKIFSREKGFPQQCSIDLAVLKKFTYWLFKYRLRTCDKARIASDTKKAITWLKSKNKYNITSL